MLFSLAIFLSAVIAHSQTLSFTANFTTVNIGDTITFTNTSTGFPPGTTIFVWDFGENCDTSWIYNPSNCLENQSSTGIKKHVYTTAGIHQVVLYYQTSGPGLSSTWSILNITVLPACTTPEPPVDCELVRNGNFDTGVGTNTIIPANIHGIRNACPWVIPITVRKNCTTGTVYSTTIDQGGTSDLFNTGNGSPVQVPTNQFGTQNPRSGSGYAGIGTYGTNLQGYPYSEYIQQELDAPLLSGVVYNVSFYVSLAEGSSRITDIGAILSNTSSVGNICLSDPSTIIDQNISVTSVDVSSGPINDITNWVLVSGTVVGAGQKYITIGRFKWSGNSAVQTRTPDFSYANIAYNPSCYYFIEDVSVAPQCCFNPISQNVWYNTTTTTSSQIYVFNGNNAIVNGKTLYIDDLMTVDQNITFTNCTLWMGPDARIDVQTGKTITFNNCTLDAGCEMWYGVYVPTGAAANFTGCMVRNAKNAAISFNNGDVNIATSTFDKNYYHVWVSGGTGAVHNLTVTGSTFDCTGNLIAPYNTVNTLTHSAFLIQQSQARVDIGGNTIRNCNYGVNASTSNIKITGNTFTNMTCANFFGCVSSGSFPTAVKASGNNMSSFIPTVEVSGGNTINGMYRGIDVSTNYNVIINGNTISTPATVSHQRGISVANCNANNSINITLNNITNGIWGIYCGFNAGNNLQIVRNTLTFNNQSATSIGILVEEVNNTNNQLYSIRDNTISWYNKGIRGTNCRRSTFSNNNVNLTSLPTFAVEGIRVETSPQTSITLNTVSGNSTNWQGTGIRSETNSVSTISCNNTNNIGRAIFMSGVATLSVKENEMNTDETGLFLNYALIGEQLAGPILPMNAWYGAHTNHIYSYYSNNTGTVANRTYRLHPSHLGSPFYPNPFVNTWGPGLPYNPENINLTRILVLPSTCVTLADTDHVSLPGGMMAIANDEQDYGNYDDAARFYNEKALYSMLKDDTTGLAQQPAYSSFMQEKQNDNVGKMDKLEEFIDRKDVDSATSQLSNIVPVNDVEEAAKNVYGIFIDHVMPTPDSIAIPADKIAYLESIAYECPYEKGPGVYSARVILHTVFPENNYQNPCELGINPDAVAKKAGPDTDNAGVTFDIYPNPTTGDAFATISIANYDKAVIELVNQQGIKVEVLTIPKGLKQFSIALPMENKTAGLYYYNFVVDGKIAAKGKIVKQ